MEPSKNHFLQPSVQSWPIFSSISASFWEPRALNKTAQSGVMVITFKVLTPSREDLFSRPCLGAHFFVFGTAFSRKVTILSPNLDPGARGHHVTFRVFFRLGPKRGPRRDPEVPKATKKRPWGSQGVPKREPRKRPGYPKRVLGDLFRARWREGRRQLDIYPPAPWGHEAVRHMLSSLQYCNPCSSGKLLFAVWLYVQVWQVGRIAAAACSLQLACCCIVAYCLQ